MVWAFGLWHLAVCFGRGEAQCNNYNIPSPWGVSSNIKYIGIQETGVIMCYKLPRKTDACRMPSRSAALKGYASDLKGGEVKSANPKKTQLDSAWQSFKIVFHWPHGRLFADKSEDTHQAPILA